MGDGIDGFYAKPKKEQVTFGAYCGAAQPLTISNSKRKDGFAEIERITGAGDAADTGEEIGN